GLTEEVDDTGVGYGDADHHADGGGLAGTVGAEEAEHTAGFDSEAEICNGDFSVVGLADMLEFYDGHRFPWREVKASLAGGRVVDALMERDGTGTSFRC